MNGVHTLICDSTPIKPYFLNPENPGKLLNCFDDSKYGEHFFFIKHHCIWRKMKHGFKELPLNFSPVPVPQTQVLCEP